MVKRLLHHASVASLSIAIAVGGLLIGGAPEADAREADSGSRAKRSSLSLEQNSTRNANQNANQFSKQRSKKTSNKKRTAASTAGRSRYLAQNDLEADLDSELENDLESDLDADLGGGGGYSADTSPISPEPVPAQSTAMGEEVQITDIQYDSKQAGGTVMVTTSSPATYRTREVPSQNQVIIEIANAKLPDKLKRPFNTKDFKQATVSINAYQEPGSNTARIVLQYRQPRSVDVKQSDRVLAIVAGGAQSAAKQVDQQQASETNSDEPLEGADADVAGSSMGGEDFDSADVGTEDFAPSERSSPRVSSRPAASQVSSSSARIMGTSSLQEENMGATRFYGRPISIEVRDTPVRDVITLIADQSGANIIMSDDINGNITIKLRQVPWDQALSIIMKTRGLGYVRQGSVLRIAPIRQLQSEAEDARRILEAQEATLPLRVKVIPVSFANVGTLAGQIRNTLQATSGSAAAGGGQTPTGRGRIEADSRSSSIIVTDTEENIQRIEQLVRALDTAPLQVMIEGKIVEAKEDMGRNFGINWGYTGKDLPLGGLTLGQSGRVSPKLPSAATSLDFRFGTLDFFGDLDAKLALFERQSMAKIISSPRVVTMNAQQATIDQSIQIPVLTQAASTGGGSTTQPLVSVSYRPVPTTLTVTPQITSGGDILMQVSFRREFLGSPDSENSPIESRNVQTNVMVKNGQTAVIGGVYQSDTTEAEQGTPYLRNIPVLGWLFKSTDKSSLRNELLVFITPRILNADRTLPKGRSLE